MNVKLKNILECAKEVEYIVRHDEPYMAFMAEYQDWRQSDGTEKLLIGYHFEENGDVCFDPLLSFVIQDGEVKRIIYSHWTGTVLDATADPYLYEFVNAVWDRHFAGRIPQSVVQN